MSKAQPIDKPRRARRWSLRILFVLLILIVAAVAIGPWVASRLAPGIVESAAAGSIQGSVKVDRVALGWFSPVEAGPVQLLDPQGQQVATVNIDAPFSLWQIVSGRWWSASAIDLGTVTLRGDIDLVRKPDGSTNLDAAIAPRVPSAAPTGGGAGGGGGGSAPATSIPNIKVVLQVAQLDATIREQDAAGKLGPELGVQKLTGPIDVNLDQGSLTAKADLTADVVSGNGAAATKAVIKLDASAKQQKASGPAGFSPENLERATIALDATGLPSALIDALGGFGGALEEGLGAASDTTLRIDGNLAAATINLQFRSPGATADADLKLADGMLVGVDAAKPAISANIRSTGFVARLPQAAGAIEQASANLTLDAGPSLALSVSSLRIPVPAGATSGQPLDPATIDFRSGGARITVDVGAMAGQVSLPAPNATPDAPAAKQLTPFAAQPLRIVVDAADLAAPVTISGATSATLDGKSAGDLTINASAAGLLDSQGRLQALQDKAAPVGAITADVALKQFATALIQPFISAMNLPIDLALDAGPKLDLTVNAQADAAAKAPADATGLAAIPPTNATIALRSANLNADVAARLESGTLRSTGDGIRVVIDSAAPLARRLLAGDSAAPAPLTLSGRTGVQLTITDLAASLDRLTAEGGADAPLAAVDAKVSLAITDVGATLPPSPATDTQPAINAEPITISSAQLALALSRGQAPAINLEASASTTGAAAPMSLAANLTADGLKSGALPAASGLDSVLALKLAGQVKASAVPPSLLAALPALAKYAPTSTAGRSELDAAIAQSIAGAIGSGTDATITLGQPQGGGTGQVVRVQLATQSQGLGSDLYLRLSPTEAAITGGTTFLVAEPASVNAILAAAAVPAEPPAVIDPAGEPVVAAAPAEPITLNSRTKFWLRMPEAIVVPLKKTAEGALEPDFARAKDFFTTLAAEGEIALGNIPIGTEPGATDDAPLTTTYTTARLGKFEAQARVPMAALADDAARSLPANRATLKLTTDARTGEGAQIAAVSVDAKAGLDVSSPEAVVALTGINTANVDALLKRNGLITGALGDSANIALRITPVAGSETDLGIVAEIASPTISGANVSLARRAEAVSLTAPSNITWTPAPSFLNSLLVTDDSSTRVTQTSAITINLTKFAIAVGRDGAGPLRHDVFDLDAQITTPRLAMDVPAPADAKGVRAPARAVAMDGIAARLRWDPSAPAIRQSMPGVLNAAITIDGVTGSEGPAAKPSRITATMRAIADPLGNPTPDNAVVNLDADLSLFPTILIDQLANQGGLMAEVLGPTVSASATARNLSRAAAGPRGSIEATLTSPRATAQLKGDMRRGQFTQSGPTQVRIIEIRPELTSTLAGSLPLVASMEKTTSDDPAMIQASDLSIPLDQDLSKLSGVISVDLGVARFTTSSFMGSLLKAVGGRESGAIGRKVEPFVVRIDKGVATYDRFRLPLGEFSIETRGSVDLVNKRVNLVTYVPFFALTDEAMGPIKLGLGGRLDILDRTTMVPITIKGSMDKPSAGVDAGLFLQETGNNLLQSPGRLIEGIGDLLGGKKKDEPKPESPK
jgi:hypothetical protein